MACPGGRRSHTPAQCTVERPEHPPSWIEDDTQVQVIRLVSRGTIEEKILRLQERKRQLADDIIRVNNDTISGLSDEEIMSLFEF